MSVRVVAPCRLHFGLLHVPVPGLEAHPRFGGVGLMINGPSVTVELTPGESFSADGLLSGRALGGLIRLHQRLGGAVTIPGRLWTDGPPEHVGLGVGTALSLAVARAAGGPRPVAELTALTGRGQRSGIGIHGFELGGFLVDAGMSADDDLPVLHTRLAFPEQWRIVLFRPAVPPDWHGDRERTAFDRLRDPATALATTDRLRTIAFDQLIPAVRDADFPTFTDAVYRYNRLAGEPFAADQGGPYAGPVVTELVETLRSWGVSGVGQSSWGPTVFAFAKGGIEAADLAGRTHTHFPTLIDVTVTSANNCGASVSPD